MAGMNEISAGSTTARDSDVTTSQSPTEPASTAVSCANEEYLCLLAQIRELPLPDVQVEWMEAARYNDPDILKGIRELHPSFLNSQDSHGNSALHMAAANGHSELVAWLLSQGANPNLTNESQNTPLHWAAANGQDRVVEILVQAKDVDVLQRNQFGRSILTEGFASDSTAVVKSLLEHGSATEERLLSCGQESTDEDTSIIQELLFSGVQVQVREVAMATNDSQQIVGQESADQDRTGLSIWASSIVAAHWMSKTTTSLSDNSVALELGSGCGVPALVVAQRHPCSRVYATDWNVEVVDNLQHNIDLNGLSNAKALRMDWGDPSTWPSDKPLTILGADLIYQESMVDLLVNVLVNLLRPEPDARFYYVAPQLPRQGGPEFIERLLSENFRLVSSQMAPATFKQNPLASQDEEECFLQFQELSSDFQLYEFSWK